MTGCGGWSHDYNLVWRTRYPDKSGRPGKLRPTAAMMAEVGPDLWNFERLYNEVCSTGESGAFHMTRTQSDDLTKALARDGASSVIESMLGSATAENAEDRVTFVMRLLEEMAEYRVEESCCLMRSLWPVASELMMHEICDGIDLWIARKQP